MKSGFYPQSQGQVSGSNSHMIVSAMPMPMGGVSQNLNFQTQQQQSSSFMPGMMGTGGMPFPPQAGGQMPMQGGGTLTQPQMGYTMRSGIASGGGGGPAPKLSRVNWRNVNDVDLDEVRKSNDIETLESFLPNLLDAGVTQDEYERLKPDTLVKLLQICQLSLQYFDYTQDYLENLTGETTEEITKLVKKADEDKVSLKKSKRDIEKLKQEVGIKKEAINKYKDFLKQRPQFKCHICTNKFFQNEDYLDSHMKRRHQNVLPMNANHPNFAVMQNMVFAQQLQQERAEFERQQKALTSTDRLQKDDMVEKLELLLQRERQEQMQRQIDMQNRLREIEQQQVEFLNKKENELSSQQQQFVGLMKNINTIHDEVSTLKSREVVVQSREPASFRSDPRIQEERLRLQQEKQELEIQQQRLQLFQQQQEIERQGIELRKEQLKQEKLEMQRQQEQISRENQRLQAEKIAAATVAAKTMKNKQQQQQQEQEYSPQQQQQFLQVPTGFNSRAQNETDRIVRDLIGGEGDAKSKNNSNDLFDGGSVGTLRGVGSGMSLGQAGSQRVPSEIKNITNMISGIRGVANIGSNKEIAEGLDEFDLDVQTQKNSKANTRKNSQTSSKGGPTHNLNSADPAPANKFNSIALNMMLQDRPEFQQNQNLKKNKESSNNEEIDDIDVEYISVPSETGSYQGKDDQNQDDDDDDDSSNENDISRDREFNNEIEREKETMEIRSKTSARNSDQDIPMKLQGILPGSDHSSSHGRGGGGDSGTRKQVRKVSEQVKKQRSSGFTDDEFGGSYNNNQFNNSQQQEQRSNRSRNQFEDSSQNFDDQGFYNGSKGRNQDIPLNPNSINKQSLSFGDSYNEQLFSNKVQSQKPRKKFEFEDSYEFN